MTQDHDSAAAPVATGATGVDKAGGAPETAAKTPRKRTPKAVPKTDAASKPAAGKSAAGTKKNAAPAKTPDSPASDTAEKTAAPAKTARKAPAAKKPVPRASGAKKGKADAKTSTAAPEPAQTAPAANVAPPPEAISAVSGPSTDRSTPGAPAVRGEQKASEAHFAEQTAPEAASSEQVRPDEQTQPARRRRSRRGGRRRNKNKNTLAAPETASSAQAALAEQSAQAEQSQGDAAPAPPKDAVSEDPAPIPLLPTDADSRSDEEDGDEAPAAASGSQAKARGKGKGKKNAAAEEAEDDETPATLRARKMFISVLSGEQVEVVLTEEGVVQEYYVEMQHQAKVKGNIYKGVVSNIDANLQAAFVSYAGGVKNGFLQIDEVHPEYYLTPHDPAKSRKYPPIQKALKPGQEILVQVVKEPAGSKGAFVTSYLSLPGRFLVLTPGREQIGVSRKVESEEERARLRELLEGLTPGKGLGVIIRTVSMGASKTSLQRDLQFLKRLWKEVRDKGKSAPAPSLIYQELDLSTRAVRDYLTDEVQEVWVDDADTAKQMAEFATLLFPKKKNLVQVHKDTAATLFERFSLQKQLDQIQSREVPLPSGGRLVFDNTEALTAIDINSGRSSGRSNFEDMAYRTNLEAARMIPLQLRLRDIGGQVVADFIEMRDRDHWREIEKAVRSGMKGDRARYDVGKIGPFGMLEIVRQRLGSSAISLSTEPCPHCKGTGIRRNMEWQALQALRDIHKALRQAAAGNQAAAVFQTETELAFYLLNAKRGVLQDLEKQFGVSLTVRPA